MGIYRFLLASLVVAAHCSFRILGYHEGVVAVISFMILSGYVITILISKYYYKDGVPSKFYVDRISRLMPQFLLYSIISLNLLHFTRLGDESLSWMTYSECSTSLLLLNLSIFGNNFYHFFGNCMLLPASWSLGLEASFYAVAPFMLRRANHIARSVATSISIVFFVLAYLGVLDSDLYGYRLLPGTFFIFATGAAVAEPTLFPRHFSAFIWTLALILFVWSWGAPAIYGRPFLKEVLVGLLIGIPALTILTKAPFSDVDEFAGSLSYGVYLNHILLIWIAQGFFGIQHWTLGRFAVLLTAATLLATATFYLVERPTLRWRRRVRKAQRFRVSGPSECV